MNVERKAVLFYQPLPCVKSIQEHFRRLFPSSFDIRRSIFCGSSATIHRGTRMVDSVLQSAKVLSQMLIPRILTHQHTTATCTASRDTQPVTGAVSSIGSRKRFRQTVTVLGRFRRGDNRRHYRHRRPHKPLDRVSFQSVSGSRAYGLDDDDYVDTDRRLRCRRTELRGRSTASPDSLNAKRLKRHTRKSRSS